MADRRREIASSDEIADSPALGFHIPNLFDKVLDIRKCWLQDDPSNPIRLAVREFCLENGYSFYNIREHKGLMRNLIVRTSTTGEVMAIVVFGENDPQRIDALLQHTAEKISADHVADVRRQHQTERHDRRPRHFAFYKGNDHFSNKWRDCGSRSGRSRFTRPIRCKPTRLYKIARDFAALTGAETVYDLYTGTGTIANFVARQCRKVVGVEYVPEAIEDAKVNARLNGIGNAVFYAGDMKDVLNERFIAENGRPDVVILDPPRAGIHEDVARTILTAAPARIVYVSCNPATQARDVALLDRAYRVTKISPWTCSAHHVENVVQLMRRCNVWGSETILYTVTNSKKNDYEKN